MKRKLSDSSLKDTPSALLFCGHASWMKSYGTLVVPENTSLFIYAPLGAALAQSIPIALSHGAIIKKGDLQCSRISPITLFNHGYENNALSAENYQPKPLDEYPLCLTSGQILPNYRMYPPGKDALESKTKDLTVINIDTTEGIFLSELLEQFKGNVCHFGGCSWVRDDFDKRNLVDFKNVDLAEKYKKPEPSDEDKKQMRRLRFGT